MSFSSRQFSILAFLILVLAACSASPTTVPTAVPTTPFTKTAHLITDTPTLVPIKSTATPNRVAVVETQVVASATPVPAKTIAPTETPPTENQAPPTKPQDTEQAVTPVPTRDGKNDPAYFPRQMKMSGPPFQATIQNFENGFMLWRSDLNCVYAIRDFGAGDLRAIFASKTEKNHPSTPKVFGYCFRVEPLADSGQSETPPSGRLLPGGAIGKVWNSYEWVRVAMGYATAPELGYITNYPANAEIPSDAYYPPEMTLPNGKMLACEFDYGNLTTYCEQQ